MVRRAFFVAASMLLFSALPLFSQTSNPPPANSQTNPGGRGGQPCWQQAGVDKSVMEQHWAIERETRSQVSAVCTNTSLTPQQKQQQAREIRQQGKQKMEALMTPEQERTLSACQQARGGHAGGGGQHEMGGGCGEWSRQNGRQGTSTNGSGNPSNGNSSAPSN
jgi:Spy/CpxP family protein refolding chaperone